MYMMFTHIVYLISTSGYEHRIQIIRLNSGTEILAIEKLVKVDNSWL